MTTSGPTTRRREAHDPDRVPRRGVATRLAALVVALLVAGVVAGGLVGLLATLAGDGTRVPVLGGPLRTTDPDGGIPPRVVAPDAPAGTTAGEPGEASGGGSAPQQGPLIGIEAASVFDPQGDDAENDDQVPLAYDGDPSTAWTTERYTSPGIAGKDGVGLLVDLGAVEQVSRVVVQHEPGTPLAVYRADAPAPTLAGWTEAATSEGEDESSDIALGQAARYWLVLVTDAPSVGGGRFAASLSEVTFVR